MTRMGKKQALIAPQYRAIRAQYSRHKEKRTRQDNLEIKRERVKGVRTTKERIREHGSSKQNKYTISKRTHT